MNYDNIHIDLKSFLMYFIAEISELFKDSIVGIYLYGSLSYGNFESGRSDVDIIVYTKALLSTEEIKTLETWINQNKDKKWFSSLEVDFIKSDVVKNTINTIRISGGKLNTKAKMYGASIDLQNVRDSGICLYGENPKNIIPSISDKLIRNALRDKLSELKLTSEERSKSDLWNQMFLVIQLCRVIYSLKNNFAPISKRNAALWCIDNLPNKLAPMASIALSKIDNFYGPVNEEIAINCYKLIEYAEDLLLN